MWRTIVPPITARSIAIPMVIAAVVTTAVCIPFVSADDESDSADEVSLFLPPVDALAVLTPTSPPPVEEEPAARRPLAAPPVPAAPSLNIVPPRFDIPDGYALDLGRDAPRFADPVDRDRMVAFEVLEHEPSGVGMYLDYDEDTFPIGQEGDDLIAVRFERPF